MKILKSLIQRGVGKHGKFTYRVKDVVIDIDTNIKMVGVNASEANMLQPPTSHIRVAGELYNVYGKCYKEECLDEDDLKTLVAYCINYEADIKIRVDLSDVRRFDGKVKKGKESETLITLLKYGETVSPSEILPLISEDAHKYIYDKRIIDNIPHTMVSFEGGKEND